MFTGIIVATGHLASVAPTAGDLELGIDAAALDLARVAIGDSISVEGVCLTVTRLEGTMFFADVSRETLGKTTLGALTPGMRVNLEPSLRAGDPLGGHLVSGHVDGLGTLIGVEADARSWRLRFELPPSLMRYVAPKGSICVNGVSLTVNGVAELGFDVNIIPHTHAATTLGGLKAGDAVNIEIDVIARYIERLLPTFTNIRST
jgi:riboflavin synthase